MSACARSAAPVVGADRGPGAPLLVELRLIRDGRMALTHAGTTAIGRPISVAATRGPDEEEESLVVGVLVEHYAARTEMLSVRASVSRGSRVLFAPVFSAAPGETTRLELQIDDSEAVLEIRLQLA